MEFAVLPKETLVYGHAYRNKQVEEIISRIPADPNMMIRVLFHSDVERKRCSNALYKRAYIRKSYGGFAIISRKPYLYLWRPTDDKLYSKTPDDNRRNFRQIKIEEILLSNRILK